MLKAILSCAEVPFDIDTHYIPENKKKEDPTHYNHDFRYLYTTSNSNIEFDPSESNNYKWIDWEDFMESPSFGHIADKINSVLEPNVREFFKALTTEESASISVLAVSHIIPSSEEYIKSLARWYDITMNIQDEHSNDAVNIAPHIHGIDLAEGQVASTDESSHAVDNIELIQLETNHDFTDMRPELCEAIRRVLK